MQFKASGHHVLIQGTVFMIANARTRPPESIVFARGECHIAVVQTTNFQVASIDLIDDLQVSWKDPLDHGDRPAFQSLRE